MRIDVSAARVVRRVALSAFASPPPRRVLHEHRFARPRRRRGIDIILCDELVSETRTRLLSVERARDDLIACRHCGLARVAGPARGHTRRDRRRAVREHRRYARGRLEPEARARARHRARCGAACLGNRAPARDREPGRARVRRAQDLARPLACAAARGQRRRHGHAARAPRERGARGRATLRSPSQAPSRPGSRTTIPGSRSSIYTTRASSTV